MVGVSDPPGYDVLEELGRGSTAVVQLARQRTIGRLVALKRIAYAHQPSSNEHRRLQREARLLARLDHPAVVRVYDAFDHDGALVLVLDYVDGPTLATVMDTDWPTASRAIEIISTIARAL